MFYVYVLKSKKDGKLYIGSTKDLKKRHKEHQKGKSFSTKYRLPVKLVYYEAFHSEKDARAREVKLKHFGGAIRHLKDRISNSLLQA